MIISEQKMIDDEPIKNHNIKTLKQQMTLIK